jgi:hypothetical protein
MDMLVSELGLNINGKRIGSVEGGSSIVRVLRFGFLEFVFKV